MDAGTTRRGAFRGWLLGGALAACMALTGCVATKIQGTAVRGEIGRAILVPANDARLGEGGLAGVEVTVSMGVAGRGTQAVLAPGVTDENGAFSIRVRKRVPHMITIRATAEGEYDVRSSITRPTTGEKILILMRPPRAP